MFIFGNHACTEFPIVYFKGGDNNTIIQDLLNKPVLRRHTAQNGTYFRLGDNTTYKGNEIR